MNRDNLFDICALFIEGEIRNYYCKHCAQRVLLLLVEFKLFEVISFLKQSENEKCICFRYNSRCVVEKVLAVIADTFS